MPEDWFKLEHIPDPDTTNLAIADVPVATKKEREGSTMEKLPDLHTNGEWSI